MYLPDIQLHEAQTLDEASDLLTRFSPDVRALAGGTDLLVDLKSGRLKVSHVVSLGRLAGLRGVCEEAGTLRIGALTTASELLRHPAVRRHFLALRDALSEMAAPQVRNMATVGGNLASAVPSADLPPILICCHGVVVLHARGAQRTVPLGEFFVGPRRTVMRPGEIMAAIELPIPRGGFGAAYARFALRQANACALAGVAASVQLKSTGVIEAARMVMGAVAPVPTLLDVSVVLNNPPGPDLFDIAAQHAADASQPISDIRGTAAYRREIVRVLARRALQQACDRARGLPS